MLVRKIECTVGIVTGVFLPMVHHMMRVNVLVVNTSSYIYIITDAVADLERAVQGGRRPRA